MMMMMMMMGGFGGCRRPSQGRSDEEGGFCGSEAELGLLALLFLSLSLSPPLSLFLSPSKPFSSHGRTAGVHRMALLFYFEYIIFVHVQMQSSVGHSPNHLWVLVRTPRSSAVFVMVGDQPS